MKYAILKFIYTLKNTLIFLFILSFLQLQAQDNPAIASEPITLDGRQALQFGIGSNLTLTSVDNYMFSYKWMTSENRGYRLNLNVSANYIDQDIDRFTVRQSGAEVTERNTTQTNFTVSSAAEFDFLKYHQFHDRLFVFTAIGPIIQFRYDSRVNTVFQEVFVNDQLFNMQESRIVTQTNRYGVGGNAGIGIEWFVTPYISFSGEYALQLLADYRVYSSRRQATGSVPEENVDEDFIGLSLEGTGARIRLSVYF